MATKNAKNTKMEYAPETAPPGRRACRVTRPGSFSSSLCLFAFFVAKSFRGAEDGHEKREKHENGVRTRDGSARPQGLPSDTTRFLLLFLVPLCVFCGQVFPRRRRWPRKTRKTRKWSTHPRRLRQAAGPAE